MGVGKMGLPMAEHLARAGYALTVSDPGAQSLELARSRGLTVASDVPGALAAADVVLSSLPNDAALRGVAAQLAQHARAGAVYVDISTVSSQASAEVARVLAGKGVDYVRTAVSGNNKMAEAGQLTVLASGPRASYERVLPVLKIIGANCFYLGEAEQARLMKLVVNLMIAQTSAMLAEALALGRKGGLDWRDMWQVLTHSAVASPIVKAKSVQLVERDFTPTYTVEQIIKDLTLILGAGEASEVFLPQTAMTLQLMQDAIAQGDGLEDYAAIIKVVERKSNLPTKL